MQEASYHVKELLSWMITAHLLRLVEPNLRVFVTHPGGGQYDCLTLVSPEGEQLVLLNRNGSSALVAGEVIEDIWSLAMHSPGAEASQSDHEPLEVRAPHKSLRQISCLWS